MLPPIKQSKKKKQNSKKTEVELSSDIQQIMKNRQYEKAKEVVKKFKRDSEFTSVLDDTIEKAKVMEAEKLTSNRLVRTLERYKDVIEGVKTI